ncbi:hypothetical protein Tco_0451326 [Tanacetum coccineum]
MDPETLRQVYIPIWNVINDFVLDDPDVCRGMIDHLAPSGFFSQLWGMDYEQLLAEFNVRTARQVCFSAEIRMRLNNELRGRQKFEGKYAMQANWLKERDAEIASLKAQLSLTEAEAAEAIRLRGQIENVEAAEAARVNELKDLKEINAVLEGRVTDLESVAASKDAELTSSNSQVAKMTQDLSSLQLSCDELSVKASSLKFEKDKLVDQVSVLETTCSGIRDEVIGYKLFKEQVEAVHNEQVKALSDHVTDRPDRGRAINKGMQDGLAAGIDYGKARRGLVDFSAYNPSAEADYVAAINALRVVDFPLLAQLESRKDGSMADIMDLLRLEEDQVVIRETSLSFSLDVAHNRVHRIRGDVAACRLSFTDAMVPLIKPLFFKSLTGEANTSGVPTMTTTTTLSTTFIQANTVAPTPSIEVPSSSKIVFEREELDTTPEHTLAL